MIAFWLVVPVIAGGNWQVPGGYRNDSAVEDASP